MLVLLVYIYIMSFLNSNIKHLRKEKNLTQNDLALKIGIKRSLVGAYEEHRAEPKLATMQKLSYLFQVPLDTLVNSDLMKSGRSVDVDTTGKTLRVLPIVVDREEKEQISLVAESAEAGYAGGYSDPEYIDSLPSFSLPVKELYSEQTYRLFQINGDSMLPITSGSYVICNYIQDWSDIKDGECHVVVTRDRGIVYKRLWNRPKTDELLLKSDNPLYEPYTIEATEILEVWKARGYLSFDLPDNAGASPSDVHHISNLLTHLHKEMEGLRQQVDLLSRN